MPNEALNSMREGIDPDTLNLSNEGCMFERLGLSRESSDFVIKRVEEIFHSFAETAEDKASLTPLVTDVLKEFKNDALLQICATWELVGLICEARANVAIDNILRQVEQDKAKEESRIIDPFKTKH